MRKIVIMCVAACLLAGCHMNGRQSDGKEADGMDKNGELTESFDPKADSLAVCGWVKSVYKDVFDAYLRHINDIEIPSASVFAKKYFSAARLAHQRHRLERSRNGGLSRC